MLTLGEPVGAPGAGLLFGDGALTGEIVLGGFGGPYRLVRWGAGGA